MIATESPTSAEARAMALAGRVFNAAIEVADLTTIYLGERLGLYRALADLGERRPASRRVTRSSS